MPELDWSEWVERQSVADWCTWPIHRAGHEIECHVAAGDGDWVVAAVAVFRRAVCKFEFSSTKRDYLFAAGMVFAAQVDDAPCVYRVREEFELLQGEAVVVEMDAVHRSGYAQLDRENHFDVRPSLGLRVRNVAASVDDIERVHGPAILEAADPGGPLTLVRTGRNFLHHLP